MDFPISLCQSSARSKPLECVWTVLDHGLIQGSTSDDSYSSGLGSAGVNLKVNNIAFRLENNVVVLLDNTLLVIIANNDLSLEGVGKGVPVGGKRLGDLATGLDLNIEEPDGDLVVVNLGDWDLWSLEITVARLAGLELLGEIDPELKTNVGAAVGILLGHLCMHDTWKIGEGASVTSKILMVHTTLKKRSDQASGKEKSCAAEEYQLIDEREHQHPRIAQQQGRPCE
ncbi:hypothetical protein HG531_003474 [Fusarium graminearum]|nr:hypothetical protein HG531_003474 [Fusarium graminearum]